jgi:hypothetical protein
MDEISIVRRRSADDIHAPEGLNMPILRLFLILTFIGAVGPLFFIGDQRQTEFLITRLGLQDSVAPALLLLVVGAAMFCAGYGLQRLRPTSAPSGDTQMNFTLGVWAWIVFVAVIVELMGGGWGSVQHSVSLLVTKVRNIAPNENLIFCFVSFAVFQACFLCLAAIDSPSRTRTILSVAIIVTTAALSFAVGSRLQAVFVLLVPLLALGARGRLRLATLAPAAVGGVAVVYAGDVVRRTAQGGDVRQAAGVLETFISSFSQIDPMALSVQLAGRAPTTILESLKVILLSPVPRAWLENKQLVAPIVARYVYFGDTLGGLTLGMFGEYYYYFGLTGLVLLGLATGWIASYLGRCAVGGALIHHAAFLAAAFLLFASLRDGPFNDLPTFAFLGALFALHWMAARAQEFVGHRRLATN